jgi:hypothetical protein
MSYVRFSICYPKQFHIKAAGSNNSFKPTPLRSSGFALPLR